MAMNKVITISTHTNIIPEKKTFVETEYPLLNKYLEEGYTIYKMETIVKPADASYMFAIVFILQK